MSIITDNTSLSSAIQPSLVYPSLPRKSDNPAPLFHRYRSIDGDDEVSSQDESIINNNTKELQTCIHFASRLIKLRSELRSPSYMKSRTNSMQMTYSDYFQQQPQPTNSRPQSLSEVGRAQSLPNVSQLGTTSSNISEHPYSTKKLINFCEDESEIISLNSTSTDEASQLTYLTELVRRKNKSTYHLSLPPKNQLNEERKRLSMTPSNTFRKNNRSLSLRDMIHEVVDMNTSKIDIVQPIIKRERFSSLALASQLLYASKEDQKEKRDKEIITVTPAAIVPNPTLSHDTKSLFSTLSSDSESDEDLKVNKRRPTAFLVSISPSSAAAATVAKSRRKQVTRTKLL